MSDYKRAAQMFLNFSGPLSPSGRAMTFLSNVADLERATRPSSGSSSPDATIPHRDRNKVERAVAMQELRQRNTRAKGGKVSYKSIFDME
jgi:hypothetical protein